MPKEKGPLTRAARTVQREKVRAKQAREDRLKNQVQSWCNPLQNAVSAQSESVQEISREFHTKEMQLMMAVQNARDRLTHFEKNLGQIIKEEVSAAISKQLHKDESGRSSLERQIIHISEDLNLLKDKVYDSQDATKRAITALQENVSKSQKELEHHASKLGESGNVLDKLVLDFDTYCNNDEQQKAYIHRLEMLVKDMEGRVWPWRPNMDRSKSPPRRGEDEIVAWQPNSTTNEERAEWLPWPPTGPVKPSRGTSPTRSTTGSVQPTPPSSRPSSARYRGREPVTNRATLSRSSSNNPVGSFNPVGSGCAFAKSARPSSAASSRSSPMVCTNVGVTV